MRRAWRPPSKGVLSHVRRMDTPSCFAHESCGQHQNISVIVRPREFRHLGRPGHRRAHARMPVRGVRHAQPGAAQQDPASRFPMLDLGSDCVRKVWIVGGLGGVRPEVIGFIPLSAEFVDQFLLEREPGMVRAYRNAFGHGPMYGRR